MRIAVVGLGFMGSTHLQAYKHVPGAEIVAVVSDDPTKLTGDLSAIKGNLDRPSEAVDFSKFRKYATIAEVMADKDVEAVDLCLPTYLHETAALAALKEGKHVLVEKPMALDGAACDRMIAAAQEAGKVLMCAQVLRFWADFQPVVQAQRSQSLGPVRSALFRRRCAAPAWGQWLKDPEKGGGGVFDLLIHDVDMAIHLFGLPESVSATGHEDLSHGVDVIVGQMHYANVPTVAITGGWHHPSAYPFSMEYTVAFDRGTIEFSSAGRPVTLYTHDGREEAMEKPEKDGFAAELAYFVECATKNKQPEICPPAESAAAVKITRLLVEARKQNGEKVPCRL
jgi:predicted dehydrogenase